MTHDRLHPIFRTLLDDIAPPAHKPKPIAAPVKIIIERSPWPGAEPRYLWTAYLEGLEDALSRNGPTPQDALAHLFAALDIDQ